MSQTKGRRNKDRFLSGELLETAIKNELERHTPFPKICHKFHVGTTRIQKVRVKYFPEDVVTSRESSTLDKVKPAPSEDTQTIDGSALDGELYAKGFELLDDDASPHELVKILRISPKTADEINNWYVKLKHHPEAEGETCDCDSCFNHGWNEAISDMLEDYEQRGLYPYPGNLKCPKCDSDVQLILENSSTYVYHIINKTYEEVTLYCEECSIETTHITVGPRGSPLYECEKCGTLRTFENN